jgi:hypothetical protein
LELQRQQNTLAIASKPMPAPVADAGPVIIDSEPVLLTQMKVPAPPPANDTHEAALHLLTSPKRVRSGNLRIASIAEASSHLATAKTAREVAELCVAFLATRFDRAVVGDTRGPLLLASAGVAEPPTFFSAVGTCSGMQDMLVRRDAYYGGALASPDWLSFFRTLGGALPGAMFVATLKREGAPAYLFYGDHRDPHLRSDVRDAVVLLREAARAFSASQ